MSTSPDFSEWYSQNYGRVLSSVILATGAARPQAEDSVNDAFVTAYERWERVRSLESSVGWVTKVAINNAKRNFRIRNRRIREAHHREVPSVSDLAIDHDLWRSVQLLPRRQREALALRYVEDMSQAQVADYLGIAEGTAKASLNHARRNLKDLLKGRSDDEHRSTNVL